VHLRDVVIIGVVSLVLSFIATLYPSWRASRVNPAEALRYE
jgi:lipoprotein-releasing system permease protein